MKYYSREYDKEKLLGSSISNILYFIKPYQGINKINKKKIFYEENEWRYIPKDLGNDDSLILEEDRATKEDIIRINLILAEQPLIFEPEDIQYIFIDNEKERNEILRLIKNIKSIKYSHDIINTLCSKIISYEQIKGDI